MKIRLLLLTLLLIRSVSAQEVFTDTQGTLEVSSSGAAVYTLPIAMPPSASDVGPVINIVYTSGRLGGIAGVGWNINTISTISRIATRADIDGFRDGVDFDDNDKLALDGQRLILTSGNYWEAGSTYQTETQSNTKIELQGSSISPYFVVTTPDGSRSWYGNYDGANASEAGMYYIVRYEDPNGNVIHYDYDRPFGGSLCIDRIRFGGNTSGLTPINDIRFFYEKAARSEFAYTGGFKYKRTALLHRVGVLSAGQLFREYRLTHHTDVRSGYQRLVEIQEFNGQGQGANPIVFNYHNPQNHPEDSEYKTTYDAPLQFKDIVLSGDFDGDARLDFLTNSHLYTKLFNPNQSIPPITLPFSGKKQRLMAISTLYENQLTPAQSIVSPQVKGQDLQLKVYHLQGDGLRQSYHKDLELIHSTRQTGCEGMVSYPTAPSYYLEGDFNGDGISELLFGIAKDKRIHYSMQETYQEDQYGEITYSTSCLQEMPTDNGQALFWVDMNPNSPVGLGSKGYLALEDAASFGFGSHAKRYIMDFNGDGKSDILSIAQDGYYKVIGFVEHTEPPYVRLELLGEGHIFGYNPTIPPLFGDFNGDGKTDMLLPKAIRSSLWNIHYANPKSGGGNFFSTQTHKIVDYWPDSKTHYKSQRHFRTYYAMDTNGDGKTDLVEVWRKHYRPQWTLNNYDTQWRVSSYVNTIGKVGGGFAEDYVSPCKDDIIGQDCLHTSDSPDLPFPVAGSHRHRGVNKALIMVRNHHEELTYIDFGRNIAKENLLQQVSSSNGAITQTLSYVEMRAEPAHGQQDPVYSVRASAEYPYSILRESFTAHLVAKISHTAMGITKYQAFKYQDLTLHMGGLGALGFAKTARSRWYTDSHAPRLWSVQEYDMALRGALKRSYTQLSETGTHFRFNEADLKVTQMTTNSYEQWLGPKGGYHLLLSEKTEHDLLSDTRVATAYSYDPDYHLPVEVVTQHFSGAALQQTHRVTTEFENNPEGIGAAFYIGRPQSIRRETTAYGDTFVTTEHYGYDVLGNISSLQKEEHQGETLTETMVYDSFGNVSEKTITAKGMIPRTTGYDYDPTGRFLLQSTDIDGLQSQYSYDSLYGLLLSETNPFGQTTTYSYDGWGKKTRLTDYLGNATTYSYNKSGSHYTTTQIGDDGSESISVSDLLGRLIKQGSKDQSGNWSYVEMRYDGFNRKIRQSEPYFGAPSQWNSFSYDNYDRPVQTTAATGKVSQVRYDGLTTMVNDGVKSITTTRDAMGKVISRSDPGGDISYTYYANGNLKQSDYDGVVVEIEQDGWGRKTRLLDPSAGVYTYGYNGFGQLTEATTPKGTTSYHYDDSGKLIRKEITGDATDMQIDYSYDPQTKQLVHKQALSNGQAFSYSYAYDAQQRLVNTVENTPYAQFEKTVSYDGFGRVDTKTYMATVLVSGKTSSSQVQHHYKNGQLWKLSDVATATVLWQTTELNARGQLSEGVYGNGVVVDQQYDAYGLPMLYHHRREETEGAAPTQSTLMLLEFEFNPQRGLLNQRSSSLFNWQEDFNHDELDRLVRYTDNNGTKEQGYDHRGRITEHPTIGQYRYSEDHPYRVSQVELTESGHAYYQSRGKQSLVYNAFKKPQHIHLDGSERIDFSYNPFQTRSSIFYGSEAEAIEERPLQKHYSADGRVEIKSNTTSGETEFIFYIGGDAYSAPVLLKSDGEDREFLYVHRDYLGSIVAITDQNSELLEKRHFDPWGNIVKLQDGQGNDLERFRVLDRGYTGHEHLQGVALIHMNGRLYDPILHRFLSPDNYVQDPYNSQNFNRYGYVYNNPLSYTDPSGELGVLAAMAIGAAVAAGSYTVSALTGSTPFSIDGLMQSAVDGGISGAMTFGIGEIASSIPLLLPRIAMQAVAHGGFQGATAGVQGGNFWQGFASGSIASVASSAWSGLAGKFAQSGVGQISFGTISGGAGAALSGGNFWEGAATGFVVSAANHAMDHGGGNPKKRRFRKYFKRLRKKIGKWTNDLKEWGGNVVTASKMTMEWSLGVGNENTVYTNDRVANAMRNSHRVNQARDAWYSKASRLNNYNVSLTNYKGSFGLKGLLRAGLDPIEQFVGSYRVDIHSDGNYLHFNLTNTTSFKSLMYGLAPDWNRSTFRPGGNTFQIYRWSEKIN